MSNRHQTALQSCLALMSLCTVLVVAGCTAPAPTASPTSEASPAPAMGAAETVPEAGPGAVPDTATTQPPARRITPVPNAPRMSDPMPAERTPSPVNLDYGCRVDTDCAVKDVGSCCGAMPACVNKGSPTDPAAVRAECARNGMSSTCGFREVNACSCVNSRCQAQSASAPATR